MYHQLLVYADDVNTLDECIRMVKESTESLLVTSKEIGLNISAEKTKYKVMSCEQNSRQYHNIKVGHKSSESVA
jgi:hypothetical protein